MIRWHFLMSLIFRRTNEFPSFLPFSGKLVSPKWKNFKGLKLQWRDKIRLNNAIWRAWYMQCECQMSWGLLGAGAGGCRGPQSCGDGPPGSSTWTSMHFGLQSPPLEIVLQREACLFWAVCRDRKTKPNLSELDTSLPSGTGGQPGDLCCEGARSLQKIDVLAGCLQHSCPLL